MNFNQKLALLVPFILLLSVSVLICVNQEDVSVFFAGIWIVYSVACLIMSSAHAASIEKSESDDRVAIVLSFLATWFSIVGIIVLIFA